MDGVSDMFFLLYLFSYRIIRILLLYVRYWKWTEEEPFIISEL